MPSDRWFELCERHAFTGSTSWRLKGGDIRFRASQRLRRPTSRGSTRLRTYAFLIFAFHHSFGIPFPTDVVGDG